MAQLRLMLLVLGLVFLAGLAWWELRRPRQVRGSDPAQGETVPPVDPEGRIRPADPGHPAGQASPAQPGPPGPADGLALPRISARAPVGELPVVDLGDLPRLQPRPAWAIRPARPAPRDALMEAAQPPVLRSADPQSAALELPVLQPMVPGHEIAEPAAADVAAGPAVAEPAAADDAAVGPAVAEQGAHPVARPAFTDQAADPADTDEVPELTLPRPGAAPAPVMPGPVAVQPVSQPTPQPAVSRPVTLQPPLSPTVVPQPAAPIVEWPDPGRSRIIAVRLVAAAEKFPGRALRQALSAEGFVLGRFAIFHKPADDGRAVISAASLAKPGTFDAQAIDMQRFSGLSLFTVLPGPLPDGEAVDTLLSSAEVLRERLNGVLQDDRGMPVTASWAATVRASSRAAPDPASPPA